MLVRQQSLHLMTQAFRSAMKYWRERRVGLIVSVQPHDT